MPGAKRSWNPCLVKSTPGKGNLCCWRGLEQAAREWNLLAACHNLMKLHTMQTKAILAAQTALTTRPAT